MLPIKTMLAWVVTRALTRSGALRIKRNNGLGRAIIWKFDLPPALSTCGSMQHGKADMTRPGGSTVRNAHHFTDNCQDGRSMLGWTDLIVGVWFLLEVRHLVVPFLGSAGHRQQCLLIQVSAMLLITDDCGRGRWTGRRLFEAKLTRRLSELYCVLRRESCISSTSALWLLPAHMDIDTVHGIGS
jgi:hypothetical protein